MTKYVFDKLRVQRPHRFHAKVRRQLDWTLETCMCMQREAERKI